MKKFFIVFILFIFSITIRVWNINGMGRTWDENFYVTQGYNMIQLAKKGNFSDFYWIKDPDEPVLSKYFYGLAGFLDVKSPTKNPIFTYDLFYSRLVSVLYGSLSVAIIVLFGWEYFSPFVGVTAGIVFSLIPSFLGLTQRVTIESILVFFFTACVYIFIKFLEVPSVKKAYLFGVLLGLSCIIKFSNVLLIPLCLLIYYFWHISRKKKILIINKKILIYFFLGFITFIIIWPMPWLHLNYMIPREYTFRFTQKSSPWEWFFGLPIHVPKVYYFVHFLIRTPLLLLILGLFGLKDIDKKKSWIGYVVILWFLFPFIQSLYPFKQHGVRYIIQVYAPFSIIAALGLNFITSKIHSKFWFKIVGLTLVVMYMGFILYRITPYYLDYFNILVGGAKGVYENHLFEFGWWGQGEKEASQYLIRNAPKDSKIGYILNPVDMMEFSNNLIYVPYKKNEQYTYVVVNYYADQKLFFDERVLQAKYKLVYTVYADGAELLHIYALKTDKFKKMKEEK